MTAWDRLLRAIWKLYFPIILPYPADWDEPLFALLAGIFRDAWEIAADPLAAVRRRYYNFITAAANVLGLEDELIAYFDSLAQAREAK